jgi:hypothetical protein
MRLGIIGAGVLFALFATAAWAQDEVQRGDTVTTRARPDYDPLGIRLGSFLLFPQLGVQESYDSNIFATNTREKGDFITSIDPSLDLRSNWNNHALNFHADSHSALYGRFSNENINDYTLAANGRLDIQRDARLIGDAGSKVAHEARFSPEDSTGCPSSWSAPTTSSAMKTAAPPPAPSSTSRFATSTRSSSRFEPATSWRPCAKSTC